MGAKRIVIAVIALVVAMLACNLPVNQGSVKSPDLAGTITARAIDLMQPSATPVFTSVPRFTELTSLTPTPILTLTPSVPQVRVIGATNCRTGPGTVYDLLYTFMPAQTAEVVGKDTSDSYWIIKIPGGSTCWLWGQSAVVSGNVAGLPEVPPPPTSTPSLPANPSALQLMFHCSLSSSPFLHNDIQVNISWQDNADNESGYYVFRDGALLATLSADSSGFSDDTTMVALVLSGDPSPHITYAIQAFNGAGKSRKISKSISCFD